MAFWKHCATWKLRQIKQKVTSHGNSNRGLGESSRLRLSPAGDPISAVLAESWPPGDRQEAVWLTAGCWVKNEQTRPRLRPTPQGLLASLQLLLQRGGSHLHNVQEPVCRSDQSPRPPSAHGRDGRRCRKHRLWSLQLWLSPSHNVRLEGDAPTRTPMMKAVSIF